MADDEMKNILKDLQLEYLEDDFKRNRITKATLKHLDEELIKDLIPVIGDRCTFLTYWKLNYKTIPFEAINKHYTHQEKKLDTENTSAVNNCEIYQNTVAKKIANLDDLSKEKFISIEELLSKSKTGQQILLVYKLSNKLDEKLRSSLCDIIISYLENIDTSMTNGLCEHISNMIVKTFPSETAERYYIAPMKKKDSPSNKSVISKGKLMSMWRNKKYKSNLLLKRVREESTSNHTKVTVLDFDSEIKECVKWLQENIAPWGDVIEKWQQTYEIRRNDLATLEDRSLVKIFDKWPVFKHPQGHELIDIDFKHMNMTKVELCFDIWFKFFDIIQEEQAINYKDNNIELILQQIRDKDITADNKAVKILQLLPYFVPPKRSIGRGKNIFKPSIAIAQESMIKHVNTAADVTRVRLQTRNFAATVKLTVQPYIITVGPDDTVNEIYICVDETLYKVDNIIKALDLCFKTFHVFQLSYPLASEHLWLLIQRGIYNFDTKWDTSMPYIAHILRKIKDAIHDQNDENNEHYLQDN